MRKLFFLSVMIFGLHTASKAQAYTGQSDFKKSVHSAVLKEMPYDQDIAAEAINNKFKNLGYNGKSDDDYKVYRGVKLSEIGPDTYDLYIKTDRKSKKEKDKCVVCMLISKGNENFVNEAGDPELFANAKSFLDKTLNDVAAADLEKQISDQEEVVKKATKKLNGLSDDGNDLLKKKKKIEEEISNNQQDLENQQKEVSAQQQVLETLKAKRKQ